MATRTYDDGTVYTEGTEGTLMAVWYAMKYAVELEQRWGLSRKWRVMNTVLRQLGIKSQDGLNYSVCRRELIHFAMNHGVVKHGASSPLLDTDPFDDLDEDLI